MSAVANPPQIHRMIGGTSVCFETNHNAHKKGFFPVASRMFTKTSAASDLMKGIRESCHLFQSAHKEAPFLSAGMNHAFEHCKAVSGYAFGALSLPYWFSVVDKVQGKVAKQEYDLEFSRHLTEVTAVTTYAVAPWISNKLLSGSIASVGKVLSIWPQAFDLQSSIRKLIKVVPLVNRAGTHDDKKALKATIFETSFKISKLVLVLFATIASVVSILTGFVLPAAVAIAALAASLGSVVFSLMAEQVRVSSPLLAI